MSGIFEKVTQYRQLGEVLSLTLYHHLFAATSRLIDDGNGVMAQHVGSLLGRRIIEHLGFDFRIEGMEHTNGLTNYCVVSSHASYLDWAILLGYLPDPVRFIAKKELSAMPAIGDYLRHRGVLIDRKRGIDAKAAIGAAVADGQPWPILIFPEGTRTPDGSLRPFKRGGLRILAAAGKALLPVYIYGTFHAMPRQTNLIKAGGKLALMIGAPVMPDAERGVEWALDEVERRMRELYDRANS